VSYKVIVERGYLEFSASHFITYGGKCERIHGHNYAVSVELKGELTEDRYVFDFVVLKKIMRDICDSLDHRFLLPLENEHLEAHEADGEWELFFRQRRYVVPAQDVLALPIDNVTAERLAEYICKLLLEKLREHRAANIVKARVGVEESPGQTGYYSTAVDIE
jgi:6-pyruvoyl tetrahydropterin synthase/QueD family protein